MSCIHIIGRAVTTGALKSPYEIEHLHRVSGYNHTSSNLKKFTGYHIRYATVFETIEKFVKAHGGLLVDISFFGLAA